QLTGGVHLVVEGLGHRDPNAGGRVLLDGGQERGEGEDPLELTGSRERENALAPGLDAAVDVEDVHHVAGGLRHGRGAREHSGGGGGTCGRRGGGGTRGGGHGAAAVGQAGAGCEGGRHHARKERSRRGVGSSGRWGGGGGGGGEERGDAFPGGGGGGAPVRCRV